MEIGGICVPAYHNLPSNVCDFVSCPLQAGQKYQITEEIVIPSNYPDVSEL